MTTSNQSMFGSNKARIFLGSVLVAVVAIAFVAFDGFSPNSEDAAGT